MTTTLAKKNNTELISTLSSMKHANAEVREIALATEQPTIKDMDKKTFVKEMNALVMRTIFESGFKFDESDATNMLMVICDDLLRDYSHLTLSELQIAYRKGVRKLYGEYYGLTVITFYQWVEKYNAETRLEAMKIKREAQDILNAKKYDTPVPTKGEWQKQMYNSSLELFERYKQSKDLVFDIGNIHYNFLSKMGLIVFTDAKQEQIFAKTEEKLKRENSPANASSLSMRKTSVAFLKSLEAKDDSAVKQFNSENKRTMLSEYFDDLIFMQVELKTMLDEKLKK